MTEPTALRVSGVRVQFGGVVALDHVDLEVPRGRLTGLIGPNGAGKTTLFNVITGLQQPSAGHVLLDDEDITWSKPHQRARLGVARTFQRLQTFDTLDVLANVLVALEARRRWSRQSIDAHSAAERILARVGISDVARERVDSLPTGTARLVEVARALAIEPKFLLLDEPSSGQSEAETEAFGAMLRDLADEGLGVLVVEHDVAFVLGLCDSVSVLDFGRVIARGSPKDIRANADVRAAYLGTDEGEAAKEAAASAGAVVEIRTAPTTRERGHHDGGSRRAPVEDSASPVLELRGISAGYGGIEVLSELDLRVEHDQIVALLGPNGAGKSTALKVASGALRPTGGSVYFDGEDATRKTAYWRSRAGLCFVPEGHGVFPNLTVTENLRMASFTGVPFRTLQERSFERFPRLGERRNQLAGTLSGGEQQMLAVSRALCTDPKLLILDELSMGLAPMVVAQLFELVREIAREGVSVLVVEQFAAEALDVADVAGVLVNGSLVAFDRADQLDDVLADTYLGEAE